MFLQTAKYRSFIDKSGKVQCSGICCAMSMDPNSEFFCSLNQAKEEKGILRPTEACRVYNVRAVDEDYYI